MQHPSDRSRGDDADAVRAAPGATPIGNDESVRGKIRDGGAGLDTGAPQAAPGRTTPADKGVSGEIRDDRTVGTVTLTHWYTPIGRGLAGAARGVAAFIGTYPTLILTLLIGAAIVFGLTWVAAEVYDAVTDHDGVAGIDRPLLDFALTLRSPAADAVITAFTDTAGTIGMPIIAVVSAAALGIVRRSWTPVILILATGAGSLLMTIAGKGLITRERPPLSDAVPPFEHSSSFPSGHTLNAIAVIGIIAYLLILRRHSRWARLSIGIAAGLYALLVGLSRVFLGHHWFTDVLAGWLLGGAWLALVITAHRLYLTIREQRASAVAVAVTAEPPS